jgi:hypothetical protein
MGDRPHAAYGIEALNPAYFFRRFQQGIALIHMKHFFVSGLPLADFLVVTDIENPEFFFHAFNIAWTRRMVNAQQPGKKIKNDLAVTGRVFPENVFSELIIFDEPFFIFSQNSFSHGMLFYYFLFNHKFSAHHT